MQKGLQTRLSVYLILKSLINNKYTYDKLLKKEIEKNKYSARDINFIQSVVLSSLRHNMQVIIMLKHMFNVLLKVILKEQLLT